MKAQMLKIAGVKTEAQFYKKFPDQEAFMKVHGKEFKKAQVGTAVGGGMNKQFIPKQQNLVNFQDIYDQGDMANTGSTDALRKKAAYDQSMIASQGKDNQGGGLEGIMDMAKMFSQSGGAAKYGSNIRRAQGGVSQLKPMGSTDNSIGGINAFDVSTLGPQGPAESKTPDMGKMFGVAGELFDGYQMLRGERTARKQAQQNTAISDITRQASATRPEQSQRKYVRPEDIQNTGEEFFPIYGVGTNPLARNGGRLQSGGEIQNTYAPNNLYDDLGYEPLNDSNKQKTFKNGGMSPDMYGQIGNMATQTSQSFMGGQNAGGKIGGTLGKTAGTMIGGPLGGAIGEFVGGTAGNLLDTNARKTKKFDAQTKANTTAMAFNSGMQGIQQQHNANVQNGGELQPYEDGGWVSNEWQPQVIASFGGLNEKEVYDYAHEGMDNLRAGGHLNSYTPPSNRAMETMAMGGQLQTHWGGEAETVSHNPYSAGSGETVNFKGQSHTESDGKGNTGIGITYGNNPVEVERGEPMFEMEAGGQIDPQTGEPEKTGVVFGNMKVDKKVASQFKDPELMAIADKYNGKKFKNIGLMLSKDEEKQNKIVSKNTDELTALKVVTSFDKLKMSSLKANLEGADAKLKNLANTKVTLANYQNAINEAKDEISEGVGKNISAEDLSRGLIKIDRDPVTKNAKHGGNIKKAQSGWYDQNAIAGSSNYGQVEDMQYLQNQSELEAMIAQSDANVEGDGAIVMNNYKNSINPNGVFGVNKNAFTPLTQNVKLPLSFGTDNYEKEKFDITPWMGYANQALKYLRPSDQEGLDNEQLYPEWNAMASNQLDPVPAQFYQPDLNTPYDISLQAQRNAVTSRDRALQRQLGYNPSAQSNAAPNAYNAMNEINQAEFQANQGMKNQVYAGNRATMNDAQKTNLGIAADQWNKQALAKSNTKATTQAALNSIADKYAKNKLENRTLATYENMYNYRFGKDGKADNWNPLAQFDTEVGGGKGKGSGVPEGWSATNYDANGNPTGLKRIKEETPASKNGSKIKKNSSIVRAYKNL
jgi:hypothetical protein